MSLRQSLVVAEEVRLEQLYQKKKGSKQYG